ncbi:MAG: archease [Candidatus Buchananbacteria bacterium]|nr:archease [Candidatus Buchananbacteria bacterium]
MEQYENLEHTADLKIRAFGKDKKEVFVNMAKGMFDNMIDNESLLKDQPIKREIRIDSVDLQSLLVDFLSELLYLSDTNDEIYNKFELIFKDLELKATIAGYKVEKIKLDIKAVTYNDLVIKEKDNQWIAEVVFDI